MSNKIKLGEKEQAELKAAKAAKQAAEAIIDKYKVEKIIAPHVENRREYVKTAMSEVLTFNNVSEWVKKDIACKDCKILTMLDPTKVAKLENKVFADQLSLIIKSPNVLLDVTKKGIKPEKITINAYILLLERAATLTPKIFESLRKQGQIRRTAEKAIKNGEKPLTALASEATKKAIEGVKKGTVKPITAKKGKKVTETLQVAL